jgi:PadR family transcriptional regulator PadR
MAKNDLQGTLDLLVLKTLSQTGSLHGYGIVLHIQRVSEDLLRVEFTLSGASSHGAERMDPL